MLSLLLLYDSLPVIEILIALVDPHAKYIFTTNRQPILTFVIPDMGYHLYSNLKGYLTLFKILLNLFNILQFYCNFISES